LHKNLNNLLALVLSCFLFSCSSIKDLDKPFCVEMNIAKGFCTTPISGKDLWVDDENKLEGKTWFEIRPVMIMIPPSTWAAIKKYIINQCKRNSNMCDANISSWDRTITVIDGQLNTKAEPQSLQSDQ